METNLIDRVVELAIAIQQVPAPTFDEGQRVLFIRDRFEQEGLCAVEIDPVGNVYACLKGEASAPPLILSAHSDTVFPSGTNLKVTRTAEAIYGPGIGDNSMGIAGLFGLLWAIRERNLRLPGDLWLVSNVGEEGLGNLKGMRAVVDRFGEQTAGYLVVEGMALGQIYHRGLGVRRYQISAHTTGGHSWVDFGRPSAVHELAGLVGRLAALSMPETPRCSLNVGMISGGTSVNTIAAEAHLQLDLRSEGSRALGDLSRQAEDLAAAANRPGVRVQCEVIGERPVGKIAANHPLVKLARRALEAQGIAPSLGIGSTDANVPLSRGFPAICVGISSGGGAHTVNEYVSIHPVAQGIRQLLAIVTGVFEEISDSSRPSPG